MTADREQTPILRLMALFILLVAVLLDQGLFSSIAQARTRGISVTARTSDGAVKSVRLYSGYHALVVGCGKYRSGWPRLPNPVKDAREVAKQLRRMGWKVDLLEDPDWSTLRRALNRLIVGPGKEPEKAILFWYSGHGHTLKEAGGRELGYIVPVDAPDPDRDELGFMEHAISMRQLETVAKRMQARHSLMLFDSCFSGAIFQAVRAKPTPFIEDKISKPVRQFITAGNEDEEVPDRSVFKEVFLQAITDGYGDRNKDGFVTGLELGDYLQEQVINYSREAQHPQFGKINDPKLDKGDFVIQLASSGAVVDQPTKRQAEPTLSVESNVTGAKVYVDGRLVGRTDLSGVKVSAGEHRIRVEKDGYETYNKRIRFRAGRNQSLTAYLDVIAPQAASLYVDTVPEGATVRILNIGPKFRQGMDLAPGRYHVKVSARGFETNKTWVTLAAGEDRTISVRLHEAAVAESSARQKDRIINSLGMEFVYIEPGTFTMGSPPSEAWRDGTENQHRVTLTRGFYMQTTETTKGQWKATMGGYPKDLTIWDPCGDDCPVREVAWDEVQEFIAKLNHQEDGFNYRLPTEAEWEYAVRAGSTTQYGHGDGVDDLGEYAWYEANSDGKVHPVARKRPNAWGLYDMQGNVKEFCQDVYNHLPTEPVIDPVEVNPYRKTTSGYRVVRGGNYSAAAIHLRSASRASVNIDSTYFHSAGVGFRLVMTD